MLTRFFLFSLTFLCTCTLSLTGCGKKNNGTYKIAFDPLWYPLDFKEKNSHVIGFSTELLSDVAKEESLYLSLLNTNWDSLLQGLQDNHYQAILSSLYPYNFNLSQYDFSDVYLATGPVLLLPFSSTLQSLSDMESKEIGVLSGSSALLITKLYPSIYVRTYEKDAQIINDLLIGRIDGALLPILNAQTFVQGAFAKQLKIATNPLNEEGLRLLTLKGKFPDFIKRFNKALHTMEKNGQLLKLLEEWNLAATKGA